MPKSFLITHKRYELEDEEVLQDLSQPRDSGSSSTSGFSEEDSCPEGYPSCTRSSLKARGTFVNGNSVSSRQNGKKLSGSSLIVTPKKRRLPQPPTLTLSHSWKELNNNGYIGNKAPQIHIKEEPSSLNASFKSLIVSATSTTSPSSIVSSSFVEKNTSLAYPNHGRGNVIQFYPSSPEQVIHAPQQHPSSSSSYQIKLISPPPGGTLTHPGFTNNYKRDQYHHRQQIKTETMTPSPLQVIIAAADHQRQDGVEDDQEEMFIEGSRSEQSQQYQLEEPTNQLIHHQEQPVNLSVKKVDLFNLTQLAEVSIAAAKREMSLRSSNVSNTTSSSLSSSTVSRANSPIYLNNSSKPNPTNQTRNEKQGGNNNENLLVRGKSSPKSGEMGISEKTTNHHFIASGKKKTDSSKMNENSDQAITGIKEGEKMVPTSTTNSSCGNSTSPSSSSASARHRCVECGKGFSTLSNLARHRQTHRSLSDASAVKKCPHCDKVYVSMPAFSMHLRTHNQGCKCPYCGKGFSRPWLLQGHIRTHTGEKPFKCGICNKAFADKSNLRAHTQTHSTEKPFVCSRCGKPFALKSYLCKHIESSCMKSNRPSGPSPATVINGSSVTNSTTSAINNSSSSSSPVSSTGGTSPMSTATSPSSSPTNSDIPSATTTVIAAGIMGKTLVTKTTTDSASAPLSSRNNNTNNFRKVLASKGGECSSSGMSKNNAHGRTVAASGFFLSPNNGGNGSGSNNGKNNASSKSACYRGSNPVNGSKIRKTELLKPSA